MASNIQAIKTIRPAVVSLTYDIARSRTLRLYRNCLRSIPFLVQHYNLSYSLSEMRKRIRDDFEQYREVKELNAIDRLRFIGETEIFDAMSLLKTRSHVVNYFDNPIQRTQKISESDSVIKNFFNI
eukprot:gene9901-12144_t